MESNSPIYLMPPQLHAQLSYVDNFNVINGASYQDYINIQLFNIITKEQRDMISATHQVEDALELLNKMNISYSHVWDETVP